jgi:hypothetical protein
MLTWYTTIALWSLVQYNCVSSKLNAFTVSFGALSSTMHYTFINKVGTEHTKFI